MDSAARHREAVLSAEPRADWSLARGATPLGDGSTRFTVWAPRAARLVVELASGAARGRHALAPLGGGVHEVIVPGAAAGDDYAFSLDGGPLLPDPVSRWQPHGVRGPSRIVDPAAFAWTDGSWRGLALADYVLYELHVGAFTAAGTFDAAAACLRTLAHLGVTAVELMPVAQFPGTRNWGYDGVSLFAPQESYGGPVGLHRFVDAAHHAGLAVVLDVVYNHVGPEGSVLAAFAPYVSATRRTAWGAAYDFDGPGSAEVRRFVVDNALYWITEYHVDALRLDAVQAMHDDGPRHILAELAGRVHAQGRRLARAVHVIGESDVMDPLLVRGAAQGGRGLDAEWSDDLERGLAAALAPAPGEPPNVGALAAAIARRSEMPSRDGRRASRPAHDLPAERFVCYAQNHDVVGNRPDGARLAAQVGIERRKLAAAVLLLSPGVPLLFMGEEYGETHPFLYFTDHIDAGLARAVREARARDYRARGGRGAFYDPQSAAALERSRLDRQRCDSPDGQCLLALYRDLLALRRTEPALRPGEAEAHLWRGADAWLAMQLTPAEGPALLALFNFSDAVHEAAVPDGAEGIWRLRFSTRNARYGGPSDSPRVARRRAGERRIAIRPLSAALYRREAR